MSGRRAAKVGDLVMLYGSISGKRDVLKAVPTGSQYAVIVKKHTKEERWIT